MTEAATTSGEVHQLLVESVFATRRDRHGRAGLIDLPQRDIGGLEPGAAVHGSLQLPVNHAVTGIDRAFAAELGKHSIRVNSVHPGPVNTDMGTGDMVAAITKATETNHSWRTC